MLTLHLINSYPFSLNPTGNLVSNFIDQEPFYNFQSINFGRLKSNIFSIYQTTVQRIRFHCLSNWHQFRSIHSHTASLYVVYFLTLPATLTDYRYVESLHKWVTFSTKPSRLLHVNKLFWLFCWGPVHTSHAKPTLRESIILWSLKQDCYATRELSAMQSGLFKGEGHLTDFRGTFRKKVESVIHNTHHLSLANLLRRSLSVK